MGGITRVTGVCAYRVDGLDLSPRGAVGRVDGHWKKACLPFLMGGNGGFSSANPGN